MPLLRNPFVKDGRMVKIFDYDRKLSHQERRGYGIVFFKVDETNQRSKEMTDIKQKKSRFSAGFFSI